VLELRTSEPDPMATRRSFVLGISALSLVGLHRPLGADAGAEADAVKAAEAWLDLVDAGKHGESWEQAARLFKTALTRPQWEAALTAVRLPLGGCLSRTLESQKRVTSLPGGPDGEYVVIRYETTFEKKKESVETITPMRDPDGRWRVSGYFIR